MRRLALAPVLAASALALASGCLPEESVVDDSSLDEASLDETSAAIETCNICKDPPAIKRWTTPAAGAKLWPKTATKTVVVVTRGIEKDTWRAYGVDLSNGKLAYVFEGKATEYGRFAAHNIGEWTAGGGSDLGFDWGMAGSFKKPIPVPVGPIGQPPSIKAMTAVEVAAIEVLDSMANMQAAM